MDNRIGLGKGLSAIMGEIDDEKTLSKPQKSAGIEMIELNRLFPENINRVARSNPKNYRI